MPLDREEHTRAQYENLERNKDYNKPIHNLHISELFSVLRGYYSIKAC